MALFLVALFLVALFLVALLLVALLLVALSPNRQHFRLVALVHSPSDIGKHLVNTRRFSQRR